MKNTIELLKEFVDLHTQYNQTRNLSKKELVIKEKRESFLKANENISFTRTEKFNYNTACLHATNALALFLVFAFSNGQLLPRNARKLIGIPKFGGENLGISPTNSNFVSTLSLAINKQFVLDIDNILINLGHYGSKYSKETFDKDYDNLKRRFLRRYEKNTQSSLFKNAKEIFENSLMQEALEKLFSTRVYIIGDGIGQYNYKKGEEYIIKGEQEREKHEALYEAVNVRCIIVQDQETKDFLIKLLETINPELTKKVAFFTESEMIYADLREVLYKVISKMLVYNKLTDFVNGDEVLDKKDIQEKFKQEIEKYQKNFDEEKVQEFLKNIPDTISSTVLKCIEYTDTMSSTIPPTVLKCIKPIGNKYTTKPPSIPELNKEKLRKVLQADLNAIDNFILGLHDKLPFEISRSFDACTFERECQYFYDVGYTVEGRGIKHSIKDEDIKHSTKSYPVLYVDKNDGKHKRGEGYITKKLDTAKTFNVPVQYFHYNPNLEEEKGSNFVVVDQNKKGGEIYSNNIIQDLHIVDKSLKKKNISQEIITTKGIENSKKRDYFLALKLGVMILAIVSVAVFSVVTQNPIILGVSISLVCAMSAAAFLSSKFPSTKMVNVQSSEPNKDYLLNFNKI